MIKVNLAKSQSYASAGTQTSIAMDTQAITSGESPVAKVGLIVAFLILVMGYEKYNMGILKEQEMAVRNQLTQVETEIKKFGSVTAVIEDLIKEKKTLGEKIKVIEKISQKRAFKLNTIVKVQESLPEDLWLEELLIDEAVINFKGLARTPTSVQQVVRTLNDAEFVESAFNKVLERKKKDGNDFQYFEIEATVKQ